MSRIRFSLAGLLAFTLFVGFICAALRYKTDLWTSAAVSLSALLLVLGVLAAILRPAARPFWTGFALFGLAYFYVSVGPGGATLLPRLVTTPLLERLEGKSDSPTSAELEFDRAVWFLGNRRASAYSVPPPANFHAIGHSALAILIGLVGGVAGCVVQGRKRPTDSQGAAT
jgi:hypothetical protein